MSLPHLFTQAQFELAIGGADRAVRLAKAQNASDPIYAAFIAAIQSIADATGYANAQVYAAVTDTTMQTAPMLSEMALAIGVWWGHFKGTGGMEIPDPVAKAFDIATTYFKELKAGDSTLGTEATPSTSAGLAQVDPDPDGVRLTRTTLNESGFA